MEKNKLSEPLVSIAVITYNQEKFISQTIDGILMQKTSFPIEIIISEDCSTDNTRKICIDYYEKYPEIIKLNLPETNMGSMPNFIYTLNLCKGKYIAICEGDDYWIDENKLQRQVDFLESNPDFSLSAHNSLTLGHNGKMIYNPPLDRTVYTTTDIIGLNWSIMTASIMFRRSDLSIPEWFKKVKNGDYALQLILSTKGKINYIPEYMSVYRRHAGGLTANFPPFFSAKTIYDLLKFFDKETNKKYHSDINKKLEDTYRNYRQTAKENRLRKQYIGLSIAYCFSKMGIDTFSIISRMSFFQKK